MMNVVCLQNLSKLSCAYKKENQTKMVVCDLGNPMKGGTKVSDPRTRCDMTIHLISWCILGDIAGCRWGRFSSFDWRWRVKDKVINKEATTGGTLMLRRVATGSLRFPKVTWTQHNTVKVRLSKTVNPKCCRQFRLSARRMKDWMFLFVDVNKTLLVK